MLLQLNKKSKNRSVLAKVGKGINFPNGTIFSRAWLSMVFLNQTTNFPKIALFMPILQKQLNEFLLIQNCSNIRESAAVLVQRVLSGISVEGHIFDVLKVNSLLLFRNIDLCKFFECFNYIHSLTLPEHPERGV